jgi:hypothetical protein
MPHAVVLALFSDVASAAAAAKAAHEAGVDRAELSIVARSHDDEGRLARDLDGTPGAELEDSRAAGRLGELGGYVLAALATVLPGIGPIIAAGPLAAGLGEAAGHVAGGLVPVLHGAGLDEREAQRWERRIQRGGVLLGAHVDRDRAASVDSLMRRHGAQSVVTATRSEPLH